MRVDSDFGSGKMSNQGDGVFSACLLSLQLQLKGLLEGAGGEHALSLLDALCNLSPSEQKLALSMFTRTVRRIQTGSERLISDEDRHMREMEDSLYSEIVEAMHDAGTGENKSQADNSPKLDLVDGGRNATRAKAPVDLARVRKLRKNRSFPQLVS